MAFITNLTATTPDTGAYKDGNPDGIDNDLGAIQNGGNADAVKFSAVALGDKQDGVSIVSGVDGIDGIISSSAFNRENTQVVVKATSSIAGISNQGLLAGASDSASEIGLVSGSVINTKFEKEALRDNKWNEVTATWDSNFPETSNTSGGINIATNVKEEFLKPLDPQRYTPSVSPVASNNVVNFYYECDGSDGITEWVVISGSSGVTSGTTTGTAGSVPCPSGMSGIATNTTLTFLPNTGA